MEVTHEFVVGWDAATAGQEATDAKVEELCPGCDWARHVNLDMSTPGNQALDLGRKGCFISFVMVIHAFTFVLSLLTIINVM